MVRYCQISSIEYEYHLYNSLTGLEGVCYHKLGGDLKAITDEGGLIDRLNQEISREIEETQV